MLYTTMSQSQSKSWHGQYGNQDYDQLSMLTMDDSWYNDAENWDGWISATNGTIYDVSQMAFYHDVEPKYDEEPDCHFYPCKDPDCEYCYHIGDALSTKISAWYESRGNYTLDMLVSYETFTAKYPLIHDETDDTWSRNVPDWLSAYYMQADSSLWMQEEDEEDEEDTSYEEDEDEEEDHDHYEEEEDYDRAYNRYHYEKADVVDPDHFDSVFNGWLAPNGTFYYVPDYNNHGVAHWETARTLGFNKVILANGKEYIDPVEAAERAGYIHISYYYDHTHRFHFVPTRPTKAQKETARLYADANDIPLPESLEDDDTYVEDTDQEPVIKSYTFWQRVAESCMSRSMRDRFYPLSGD